MLYPMSPQSATTSSIKGASSAFSLLQSGDSCAVTTSFPCCALQTTSATTLLIEPEVSIRRLFKCYGPSWNDTDINTSKAERCATKCHGNHHYRPSNKNLISAVVATSPTVVKQLTTSSCSASPSSMFQCEYCNFSCSWKYDLKLHLKQKHGVHKKNI